MAAEPGLRRNLAKGESARHVYESIRQQILGLELRPGASLDEAGLVESFGVSRTPVREALIRLAADRLVILLPNRGARVAPIELDSIGSFFEALNLCQRAVTRWAALRRTPADLASIRKEALAFEAATAAHDVGAMSETNLDFHMAIARAAANPHIASAYRHLLVEGLRLSRFALAYDFDRDNSQASHFERVIGDHRHMLALIEAGDAGAAERLGATHTALFRDRVLRNLAYIQADEITIEDRPPLPARPDPERMP
jgi:DNA-binding GntR family transcriptional regulator